MLISSYCRQYCSRHSTDNAFKVSRICVGTFLVRWFNSNRFMSTKTQSDQTKFDFDYFVIGGGSGGVRSSRIAAQHGARVALAEDKKLGGTCVNVGCVPKKLFYYASHFRELFHDASGYGWPNIDMNLNDHNWKKFIEDKNAEIQRLNNIYEKNQKDNNVELIKGRAELKDKHTIVVNDKEYSAKNILVAVGGHPVIPPIEGREHIITSDDAFFLEKLPKNVIIVGGGYIATEFACIFNGFGCEVTLVLRGKTILTSFDEDVRAKLTDELKKNGINIRYETQVERVEKFADDSFRVQFKDSTTTDTNLVMFAIGRQPNTKNLGLEKVGIKTNEKGVILVDGYSHTSIPHIFAVGDCTDRKALTPVAIQEGHYLADMLFGNQQPRKVDYDTVGSSVFSQPAIGTCGLTEQQAREKYGPDGYDVYESTFKPMYVQLPKRDQKSYVKLIVEKTDPCRVVGIHLMDHSAPEVIQMCSVAIRAGATKEIFDHSVGIHPTSAEEIVQIRKKREKKTN